MPGIDTEEMTRMFARMQWALQTQDGNILPFEVDEQRYNAFPQRRLVQVVDLRTQQPDPGNNITFNVQITQPFANTDLTLVSKKPVQLRGVTDMYEQNGAPKGNWMLLTEKQIQWLLEKQQLSAAMIKQDQLNNWERNWRLELEDQYWLHAEAHGQEYLTDLCGRGEPTFQIRAKITNAVIKEEDAAGKEDPAGKGHVLCVQRKQTLVAGKKQSANWSYCANPSEDEAMPVVDKNKTQLFFFCFRLFAGQIPMTTTYNIDTECAICMCDRKEFRVAGCGHAFCQGCVAKLTDANSNVKCPYCRATSSSDDMLSVQFPQVSEVMPEVSDVVPKVSPQLTIAEVIADSKQAQEDWQLMLLEEARHPTTDDVLRGCFKYHGFVDEYKHIPRKICDILNTGNLDVLLTYDKGFFDEFELEDPYDNNPTDWKTWFLDMLELVKDISERSKSEWDAQKQLYKCTWWAHEYNVYKQVLGTENAQTLEALKRSNDADQELSSLKRKVSLEGGAQGGSAKEKSPAQDAEEAPASASKKMRN